MKVENKTLAITDPCYIATKGVTCYINESTIYGDWSCMCYKCDKEQAKEKSKEWDKIYFGFFNEYNFTGKTDEEKMEMNKQFKEMKRKFIEENCYGEFCADSGRVAVYDYDTLGESAKRWIEKRPWCACIIPNYTGNISYQVEYQDENDDEGSAHIVGDGFYTTQSGL